MSESDPRLLTETERADLIREVSNLKVDRHQGKYLSFNDRLLIRAAQHIDAVAARDEVIAKGIRVIDLDHQRLQGMLEKIAEAYRREDYASIYEVLLKEGFIE